jgi:L-fucose isomerase-like protein
LALAAAQTAECDGAVPPFGYLSVASSLHDAASVDRITAGVRATLDHLGGQRVDLPEAGTDQPFVVIVATGGTEAAILDAASRRHAVVPYEPVILVAHRLHNSLPAALEALARLHQDGINGRIVQVNDTGTRAADTTDPTSLADTVSDVAVIHRLHHTRLGLIGEPSNWLVASVPDAHVLRQRWGIELVDVDISRAIGHHTDAADLDRTAARSVAVHVTGRAADHLDDELERAAALHPALVDTIEHHRLDAVAVRCFDFLTELSTSGCVALAHLNDTGVAAGCEGDVASTVGMLLVRHLLEQPCWIANPAEIDTADNRMLLAHCTVAPSMVSDIEVHTHFESGLGIGLRGTFSPGPVTLVRLGGARLDRHWVAEGTIEETGDSPDLCRTQVTVRVHDAPVGSVLDDPLGNHVLLVHGHHRARIEGWWRLAFGRVQPA